MNWISVCGNAEINMRRGFSVNPRQNKFISWNSMRCTAYFLVCVVSHLKLIKTRDELKERKIFWIKIMRSHIRTYFALRNMKKLVFSSPLLNCDGFWLCDFLIDKVLEIYFDLFSLSSESLRLEIYRLRKFKCRNRVLIWELRVFWSQFCQFKWKVFVVEMISNSLKSAVIFCTDVSSIPAGD